MSDICKDCLCKDTCQRKDNSDDISFCNCKETYYDSDEIYFDSGIDSFCAIDTQISG